MPIKWKPRDNKLTNPPSYAAFPVDTIPLEIDDIARNINILHPTITESDVKIVLNAFRREVLHQISTGNSITLENFLSIYPSISQRLYTPNDRINKISLSVKSKVSAEVVNEIRQVVTFEKIPYMPKKQPSILSAALSAPVLEGSILTDVGFTISGSNLQFNALVGDEGVFLLSSAGNIIKQENVSLNTNAKVIITPTIDSNLGPAGYASVENVLSISTRYTPDGELRTGYYSGYVRQKNFIGDAFPNFLVFVIGEDISSPVNVKHYDGPTIDINCIITKTPGGEIYAAIGNVGSQGDEVQINGNGDVVLSGDGHVLTLQVLQFDWLIDTLSSRGNYIREIINISSISTIGFTTTSSSPFVASIVKSGDKVSWDMGNGDIIENANAINYSGYSDSSIKNVTIYHIAGQENITAMDMPNSHIMGSFPDISSLIGITRLDFSANSLSGQLDLSSNTSLVYAYFHVNQFTGTLDLSANTLLVNAYFYFNQFTGDLDLSTNTLLQSVRFQTNQFTGILDLSSNTSLVDAYFHANKFTGVVGLSNCTNLNVIDLNTNLINTDGVSSIVDDLWSIRQQLGPNNCIINLSGNAAPDIDAIDKIEGTGPYIGDGLKDAGCTVVYST